MRWNEIKSIQELDDLKELSKNEPVLLFKHSTRCSISSAAKGRMERHWDEKNANNPKPIYLDLIAFRDVSNKIAVDFNIEHQSPQVLLIKDGNCVFNSSHSEIDYAEILQHC